ncbi:uncharacterized protein K02A2.6-like [Haliotis rufescens]|uniref:uncharacterized protein K02A2.6-like n=1 Tax=Haliotis rufescens TaxID=6454 RepID=UPI00201F9A95|nr:uncharacterized protein K02A2.6-like [Haliotis rufescens]
MNDRSSGRGHSRGRGRDRGRGHGRGTHYKDNRSSTNHANRIDDVSQEDENNEYGLFKVETQHAQNGLSGKRHRVEPYLIEVLVNGKKLTMEIDTGAATSVISSSTFHSVWKEGDDRPKLSETNAILRSYNRERIPIVGTTDVQVNYGNQSATLPLTVVEGDGENLLGRDWLQAIRLDWGKILNVRNEGLQDILNSYSDVFQDDIGEFKDQKVTIEITSNVPRFYKHRNVAYALRQKVDDELERLEKQGIIKPVQYSDWAAPIVPVVKSNGNIRICGDYKLTVNKVARTNVYPIPLIEDLFASLSGGKTFTKLDLSQAYQQLTLDEESQKLTTINTHRGLYQYQHLPFGISTAPAVFQRTMECLLKDIPHVCVYLDDILVTGASEQEHLENMKEVLSRLSKAGLRLNAQKCKFMVGSVEYLGHKIDAQGLHPLDEKVKAIVSAPAPCNVAELKSFLGLVQYYQRFLPNLATTLAPLHRLLRKEVTWSWGAQQKKAFNMVKGHLSSCDLLTHYDPHKKLVLACDASPYGVGAVLSHQSDDGVEKPIAFASRSLSQAEKNYSQLDREALAIIFGTKKFHQYIYGRSFALLSDHKPLESIFSRDKGISQMASSRIQRWTLTLSAYNYTIEYRKGTSLANADCMSRLPLPYTPPNPPLPGDTILLLEAMDASPVKSWQIKQWTDRDPTLSRVRNFLLSGWPSINLEESFTPFVKRKHELSVLDGCVLWGNRIVVPPQGREIVVNMLHEAHPGISRMKSVARGFVWWPKMDDELELKVKTCSVCQQSRPVQAEASLHFWEWPEHPWSRLHLDYAGPFLGKMFLVCIDAHSKWLEVFPVNSATSTATIDCLRHMFATHGLPDQVVTDNGTCFTREEFSVFMKRNGITHTCVAPYHPASNGLAERAVQTFKSGIKHMTGGTLDTKLARFLFRYRLTPQTTTGLSPAELLLRRRPKSHLNLLHPDMSCKVRNKQEQQKSVHDAHAKDRHLQVGDLVYVLNFRPGDKWLSGIITERTGPVSFHVRLDNGGVVKRHIDHLRLRHVLKHESQHDKSVPSTHEQSVLPELPDKLPMLPEPGNIPVLPGTPHLQDEVTSTRPEPQQVLPEALSPTQSDSCGAQEFRRSSRIRKAPDRLNLKIAAEL